MTHDEMDKAYAYAKTFETHNVKLPHKFRDWHYVSYFSEDGTNGGCWVRAHIFVPREAYEEVVSSGQQLVLDLGGSV